MPANTRPIPHPQHNARTFDWNNDCFMRPSWGSVDGAVVYAMLWDLNMRVANLEFTVYSGISSSNVATTAQLESLSNTLSQSTQNLAALISQNAKKSLINQ